MAAPAHQWHPHLRVDDDEDVFGLNEWPSAAADAPWPGLDMEAPRKRRRIAKRLVLLALLFSALAGVAFLVARVARAKAAGVLGLPVGLWSNGGVLTVGKDERFRLKGISWYGMEQNEHCFEGLDKVTMDSILDIVEEHGFNALSVPLAANMYEKNPTIGAECIGTFLNSDLKTLKYRTLLRHFIDKAAKRNLLVMLDLHRVDSNVWPGDGKWEEHEQKILDFWTDLTRQYANQWNVLGADIFNEPYGAKTWESWRKFAEKVGNHIQARAPRWLVVVEGVAMLDSDRKAGLSDVFWAENLRHAGDDPPKLKEDRKLALSPHVYGPSVAPQKYFNTTQFPKNMPGVWDEHFGLSVKSGAAVIVGEWGGKNTGQDRIWNEAFVDYLNTKKFGFFYWVLNPKSKDTGGLLKSDWKTVDESKAALLKRTVASDVANYLYHFQRKV